ncbi:MAG: HAD family phosphatase [Candidatus Aenigmarchaeota archaeon]|nr:HAD family phosphatase [Candidatus Aenigmarchaeota archaeon]
MKKGLRRKRSGTRPAKAPIKAILFDMGGVLLRISMEAETARWSQLLGIPNGKLHRLYAKRMDALLEGKLSPEEFCREVEDTLQVRQALARWQQAYEETATISQRILFLVARLRQRYRVGLLSNAGQLADRLNREEGLYDLFDPLILSCEVGVKKPSPRIYQIALQRLGLRPREVVFLDDRPENLVPPRKMGIRTIHYTSPGQLERDLRKLGVRW